MLRRSSGASRARAATSRADSPRCFDIGFGYVCPLTTPTAPLVIDDATTFDTSVVLHSPCVPYLGAQGDAYLGANGYCVVAATSITISGTLNATGSRPLVLVSLSTIEIDGTIDVSSHSQPRTWGAGTYQVYPWSCSSIAGAGPTGGGAGGSFGSNGGNGGSTAPPGGRSAGVAIPTSLRGGCWGDTGYQASVYDDGGEGFGGGAVELVSVATTVVNGTINASGASGAGQLYSGCEGSGGGSGGMIVFDAPSLVFGDSAMIFANGGGGSGGSGGVETSPATLAAPSEAGASGQASTGPASGAAGGAGGVGAANGGAGATAASPAMNGGDGSLNGGGGGGLGVIRVFRAPIPTTGQVSPTPT